MLTLMQLVSRYPSIKILYSSFLLFNIFFSMFRYKYYALFFYKPYFLTFHWSIGNLLYNFASAMMSLQIENLLCKSYRYTAIIIYRNYNVKSKSKECPASSLVNKHTNRTLSRNASEPSTCKTRCVS